MKVLRRSVGPLQPGEYTSVLNPETWSTFKCPDCGSVTRLARAHHSVDYTGEVTPKVTCPHKSCKFSDMVTLDGWIPEAKGNA